jgi:hypothetical protein
MLAERRAHQMADGLAWDDLTPELEGPGVGIRRKDFGGLAMCLIRLDAGTMRVHGADGVRDYTAGETYYWAPGHNLEAVTDAEYLEITRSEDYDALIGHCKRVMAG